MHRQVTNDGEATRNTDPDSIALGVDAFFSALADSRRRFVVERLADRSLPVPTCAELAVEIAADETHMSTEHVPRRRVEPVEDDLRAEQLPRLAEAGLVRWEGGAGAVRPGHSVEAVATLLSEIDRRVDRTAPFAWSPDGEEGSADAWRSVSSSRS